MVHIKTKNNTLLPNITWLGRGKKAGAVSGPRSRTQPACGKQQPAGNINRLATDRNSVRASPPKQNYLKRAQRETRKREQLGFPRTGLPLPGTGRRHSRAGRVILKHLKTQKRPRPWEDVFGVISVMFSVLRCFA